jgi:hypothetical protein
MCPTVFCGSSRRGFHSNELQKQPGNFSVQGCFLVSSLAHPQNNLELTVAARRRLQNAPGCRGKNDLWRTNMREYAERQVKKAGILASNFAAVRARSNRLDVASYAQAEAEPGLQYLMDRLMDPLDCYPYMLDVVAAFGTASLTLANPAERLAGLNLHLSAGEELARRYRQEYIPEAEAESFHLEGDLYLRDVLQCAKAVELRLARLEEVRDATLGQIPGGKRPKTKSSLSP